MQALAALDPPRGFTTNVPATIGPATCRESASRRCLYTKLAIPITVTELLPLLGSKPSDDCPGTSGGHLPCTMYGDIGPASAAVAITRHIVLPANGHKAPHGAQLVTPGTRFQDYYDGYDITIELLET